MSSTLGKWLESAPLAATGLAATAIPKIAIVISEIKVAFFQFLDDMLCSFGPLFTIEISESSRRGERLPKGPRFASESLDADTANGSVSWKLTHSRRARHFWRAPGVVSCVGKNFVRRLESDASRF